MDRQVAATRAHGSRLLYGLVALAAFGCSDDSPTAPSEAATPESALAAEASAPIAAATRAPRSIFVNPISGKDTDPGTKLKPFRTLARGLSTAIAGDTMRLAAGVYSAATNGEKFTGSETVTVPSGVTILGTLADDFTSRLQGAANQTGLVLSGNATVQNLVVGGFTTGIRASSGVQSLRGLILDRNFIGLSLQGSAKGTLTGGTVIVPINSTQPRGIDVSATAKFIMDGGLITGGGPNCAKGSSGMRLRDAAQATLKNGATLRNLAGNALNMGGTSKALLKSTTTIDGTLTTGCLPDPRVLVFDSSALTMENARSLGIGGATSSLGIQTSSNAPPVITRSTINSQRTAGIFATGTQTITITGSTFLDNRVAIDAPTIPNGKLTITGSSLQVNGTAIRAPLFKLRTSA